MTIDAMRERRILVTGATGFVGRWLMREMSQSSSGLGGIFAASREGEVPAEFSESELQGLSIDIEDGESVASVVRDVRPTAVVHLAAIAAPAEARADPMRAWRVNLLGTVALAQAVMRSAPDAGFLFVGSSEAYGESFKNDGKALDETATLDPSNVYAATKAAADLAIGQLSRDGLNALRFRPFNHTGPGQDPAFVVPAFAHQIARIEAGLQPPIIEVGNLDARRDFIDVRDVVRAYRLALSLAPSQFSGAAINLASGRPWRIGAMLETLIAHSKVPIDVRQDPARVRANDVPVTRGDAGRAMDLLGWQPEIDFATTLTAVLEHCRVEAGVPSGA